MSSLLYLIGEPASGKSTLMAALTKGLGGEVKTVPYVSWTEYDSKIAQIGKVREQFSGTDALGMAAQNHVIGWLADQPYKFLVAEGDRLANRKFFAAVMNQGHNLCVVVLQPPDDVLERRRKKRNKELGKEQDERWLKTRKTKVSNLVAEADMVLDATDIPALRTEIDATVVGKALKRARRQARAS